MEFNVEPLRSNHSYIGKKRSKKYVCGGKVNDPVKVNNAIGLLNDAVKRMLRWRVWET